MAIDMSNVNQIKTPGPIYKKKVYLTNSSVVYKGTSTPCPVEVTIYSVKKLVTTITESNFYAYLNSCGYTYYNTRYYLIVDNPYEFIYNNGTYNCVYASLQLQSGSVRMWFSVPEATSTGVLSDWTITEDPWQEIGSFPEAFTYEYKTYLDTTAGSYTNVTIGKNYLTNEEYIASYCINGVSYPDVTIVSVSGDTYTLSNEEVITITGNYSSTFFSEAEIYSILDITGNILWEKVGAYGYHIKVGNYYINKGSNYNVTSSTTASTIWHIDTDNRIYCLVNDTKYYLQCSTSGNHTVFADTSISGGYVWLYKNGNYITGTISGTTYYLYRYGSGTSGVRMHTDSTVITFQSNDPRTHTADWHTIWEGDYSITCEAINGQIVSAPDSNRVIYHILPKVSSIATSYSNMQIKVYYQFSWIGNVGTATPGNTYITEYTVSNLSSSKAILNLPVTPTDSTLSLTDFIASGVAWNATTGNITFETRGYLHPEDIEYLKTVIRITKIELYC